MCGLAGYNICLDEAQKLGVEKAQELNRIGWLYNLSRGTHAHGLVATFDKSLPSTWDADKQEGQYFPLWWYKSPGLATHSVEQGMLVAGSPINLAMHTRDYTRGVPSNNDNNHPVNVGRTWVTHNGGIDNHEDIKKKFGKQGVVYPDVDSIVIPMMLDEIIDPFNPDEVKACVDEMAKTFNGQSAYTFHAMWNNAPGLSLLALGKDRPLVIAYHEDRQIFVYASEIDAVVAMLKVFDLSPNDDGVLLGDLDDGKAMMLYYGDIVWHHTFTPTKRAHSNKPNDPTLGRYLPSGEKIGDNGGWNHYTQHDAPYSYTVATKDQLSRMFDVLADKDKNAPPWWNFDHEKAGPTKMRAFAQSLDKMYGYSPPYRVGITSTTNGVVYYGWKGETEFIFDDLGALKDIINWDDYKDSDKEPWLPVNRPKTVTVVADDDDGFADWLAWSSILPKIPKEPVMKPPKATKVTYLPDGKTETQPQMLKTPEQRNSLVRSSVDPAFVFPHDTRCGNHGNVFFSAHTDPQECKNIMIQAKLLLCSVNSLEEMEAIYPESVVVETGDVSHWGVPCKWLPDEEITIDITEKSSARFLVQESCNIFGCTKRKELYKYPGVATWAMLEMVEDGDTVARTDIKRNNEGVLVL